MCIKTPPPPGEMRPYGTKHDVKKWIAPHVAYHMCAQCGACLVCFMHYEKCPLRKDPETLEYINKPPVTCVTCRAYHHPHEDLEVCRRRAPVSPRDDARQGVYPNVRGSRNWCGEYEVRI